jgi:hypothetical protein
VEVVVVVVEVVVVLVVLVVVLVVVVVVDVVLAGCPLKPNSYCRFHPPSVRQALGSLQQIPALSL